MKQSEGTLISAEGITLGYEPGRAILRNIDLEVESGEFSAFTGPNGGGKTTLMRALLGLLKPMEGTIAFPASEGRRPRTGYMPQQNRIDRKFPISVFETVESGLMGSAFEKERDKVFEALEMTGMKEYASKAIGALSGGQLQRVLLARAIAGSPELLVLDEPDSYVDRAFEEKLYELLPELNKTSAILLVTHDEKALSDLPGKIYLVDRGLQVNRRYKL